MTLFTEQLSAVRQSQWDAQLDIFRRLSTGALDTTEQLIALNMKASRASMEQAAGTIKHFLDAKDPRDLFVVGSAAQDQWHQMFDYSRQLLGIATGLQESWSALPQAILPVSLRLMPAPTANIPTTPAQVAEQAAIATAGAVSVSGEISAAAADIGAAMAEASLDAGSAALKAEPQAEVPGVASASIEPVEAEFEKTVDAAIADEVPPAPAKPLAKALNKAAPKPASVEHPIASTLPLEASGVVDQPAVAPVERTHTPALTRGPEQKAPRASRRK